MEKPRVIIYARVSSEEQVDNTSLDNQIRCCKDLCTKRNYEIVSIFREEGASAKNMNRIKLQEALDFCSHRKNRVDFFLVWKFDRFSRDVGYHHTLKALLSRNNVKVISYSEPVEDSPAGRLLENVLASIAQFDNDDRAMKTRAGMKARLEEGEWIFHSPLGYIKDESVTTKVKPLIPDPYSYKYIKNALEMRLTGKYNGRECVDYLNKKGIRRHYGKPISEKIFSSIVQNPVYAGYISSPKFHVELLKAKHFQFAMISLEQFNKLQYIVMNNSNKRIRHLQFNPDFYLNKTIKCKGCGKDLVGGWAKDTKLKKWGYYSCRNKKCKNKDNINVFKAHENFLWILDTLKPSSGLIRLFSALIKEKFNNTSSEREETVKRIKTDIQNTKNKLLRLKELLESETYSIEEYKERSSILNNLIVSKEIELSELNMSSNDLETYSNRAIDFLSNLKEGYLRLDIMQQYRVNRLIFPDGLLVKNGVATTTRIASIFKVIGDLEHSKIEHGVADLPILRLSDFFKELVLAIN